MSVDKSKPKVLMFGWEFPPYSNGGLGTACYGLTKALSQKGAEIMFVIPKAPSTASSPHLDLLAASNLDMSKVTLKEVDILLGSYMTPDSYREALKNIMKFQKQGDDAENVSMYGTNLFEEVLRYAEKAKLIATHTKFDIIHAHDWMTYRAAINAKRISGKPLVVHIHSTEFDRTGGHPYQPVYDMEREGLHAADKVIAVSNFTKGMVVKHYGVAPDKIEVVHNAVDHEMSHHKKPKMVDDEKMVLFLGRLTIQKGPDYFLYAAKRVLERKPNVKFMIAGSGDMERFVIEKAAELGISHRIMYAGHLRGDDVDRAYQMADLYVMPSVSEPFGITPLESLKNNTPVLISKQSGVSEVLTHALKVDFWDVDEMSNKILAVLNYPELQESLAENGKEEVKTFSWEVPAQKCMDIYAQHL